MSIIEKLNEYKIVIGFMVAVVGATVGLLAYAQDQLQQQQLIIEAKSALVHDNFYQESRISRKEIEISENERELEYLLDSIDGGQPTFRQSKKLQYLDAEIVRLKKEIEEIRIIIQTTHE